jgi:hypothetical protein
VCLLLVHHCEQGPVTPKWGKAHLLFEFSSSLVDRRANSQYSSSCQHFNKVVVMTPALGEESYKGKKWWHLLPVVMHRQVILCNSFCAMQPTGQSLKEHIPMKTKPMCLIMQT